MRLNKLFSASTLLLIVGIALGGYLLTGKPRPRPELAGEPLSPLVEVVSLLPGSQSLTVKTQGTVQPRRQIDLVAQVGGKVERVAAFFAEGGFFEASDELVQLERQDFIYESTRAKARVADARQLLALELGRGRQASREWRDLRDPEANELFLRKPQLASAKAAVAAAIAEKGQAELALRRTRITAPFDGRIMQTFVDLGQYVTPGAPIARIYATDAVEVRLPLSDRQLALLNLSLYYRDVDSTDQQLPVDITGRFGGEQWHWRGFVQRTDASIDSRSGVLYVVVEIPDPFVRDLADDRPPLIIGQFVEALIPGRELDNVLMLPRAALRPENTVWTLDEEDRVQIKPVRVLQYGGQVVAVRGDFSGEIRVVTSSLNLALPGMQVLPVIADDANGPGA